MVDIPRPETVAQRRPERPDQQSAAPAERPREPRIGEQEGEGIEIGRRDIVNVDKDVQLQRAMELLKAMRILDKNGTDVKGVAKSAG